MLTEVSVDGGDIIVTLRLDPSQIAEQISFENSHLVAQHLTSNPEVARALYNELAYWADNNQI
jgi:hypothetical protein